MQRDSLIFCTECHTTNWKRCFQYYCWQLDYVCHWRKRNLLQKFYWLPTFNKLKLIQSREKKSVGKSVTPHLYEIHIFNVSILLKIFTFLLKKKTVLFHNLYWSNCIFFFASTLNFQIDHLFFSLAFIPPSPLFLPSRIHNIRIWSFFYSYPFFFYTNIDVTVKYVVNLKHLKIQSKTKNWMKKRKMILILVFIKFWNWIKVWCPKWFE